ncbi:hypothetical protein OAJ79_04515 [Verrucomicrobia bacterium]|nr:hypothetical protein [Verrucomicrobiota bacterium]
MRSVFNIVDGTLLIMLIIMTPMWDGLAIASGRLYLTTKVGEVLCLGE